MHYNYTFQAYRLEKHQKDCLLRSSEERNHVSIWNWIQRYKPKRIFQKKSKVSSEFIIDETLIKAGNEYVWLWIAVEPTDKIILGIRICIERNMLAAEQFIQSLVRRYGKQKIISTDGGGTWYPQACKFLKIEHIIYIRLMGKASLSVQSSTLKVELNVLMTIFLVEKRDAN
jgi:transposase-like protein